MFIKQTRGKKLTIIISLFFFLAPTLLLAQFSPAAGQETTFTARVIEIIEQNRSTRDNGSVVIQQKLKLLGLSGDWRDKEIIFDGTKFDVLSGSEYAVGDKVLVSHSRDEAGSDMFYVLDYVRQESLYLMALIFAVIVVVIGRLKGLRAVIVLFITFFIILKFIVPRILAGNSPLFITIIGSLFILVLAIYITEGLKRTSTIAIISIILSLFITGLLSMWSTAITKLTGFVSEESNFLVGLASGNINMKGLLLAGIIIGALGVLDDVVISQISLVQELKNSNPKMSRGQLYSSAMRVGISHISSVVNTLFLAYAGASFPMLIIFGLKQPPFLTFNQVINNEIIATEIVRTLTGSIGLVLAVPIATVLAVWLVKKDLTASHDSHHH